MADEFASFARTIDGPVTRHWQLVANASVDINPRPRGIYCEADGVITLRDEHGTNLPYTMVQGSCMPIRAVRVVNIASGTFYGVS